MLLTNRELDVLRHACSDPIHLCTCACTFAVLFRTALLL
jgi:hypothetical protein